MINVFFGGGLFRPEPWQIKLTCFLNLPTPAFFVHFCSFQQQLQSLAGFKLGLSEYKASTLTTWPPPRPIVHVLLFANPKFAKFMLLN